jgi:hypothetical protein
VSAPRFVVLGLARPRSEWFRTLSGWSTSGAVPVEFSKCVSAEEVRAHLSGGRRWSAALLDGGLPAVDRDLLAAVRDAGASPIVVDAAGISRDWPSLGAAGVLPATFTREQFLDVLGATSSMVGAGETLPPDPGDAASAPAVLGPVAAVCGPGGTGASTAAIALAQGLAASGRLGGPVVLADLCLRADQAMLHDARDVTPGVQELVEVHRGRRLGVDEVHAHTYQVVERGYHLLLGLRRSRHWSTIRPRSFEAAFASLRRAFGAVVCDVSDEFEGEDETGSIDVEERNVMARTAATQASVVLPVGTCDLKGLHSLVRLLGDLADIGVSGRRVVPVLNQAPRAPRMRAGIVRTLAELTGGVEHSTPVFLPRRGVDEALRDGVALPASLTSVLDGAFHATLRLDGQPDASADEPRPVVPGSMGSWSPQGAQG